MFYSDELKKIKDIKHCFFSRNEGFSKGIYKSLNCGPGSKDSRNHISKNLNFISQQMGVNKKSLILMNQTHSNDVVIVDEKNKLVGILTDGDLRRAILNKKNIESSIEDCMTKAPITLNGSEIAIEAVNIMEKFKVNCFLITDKDEKVIGMLNLTDLLGSKVI